MDKKTILTKPQILAKILLLGMRRYLQAKKVKKPIAWAIDSERKRSVNIDVVDYLEDRK